MPKLDAFGDPYMSTESTAQAAFRAHIARLDSRITAHEDAMSVLQRERRALTRELAALLSPIPVGAVVEVPKGRYLQGRYRITHIMPGEGEELHYVGDKLAKNGTVIASRQQVNLWLAREHLRQVGGEA